jgi:hypothetical protein
MAELSNAKLTKPQRALLAELSAGQRTVWEGYKPASRLIDLGYAEWIEGRWSASLRITEAGRRAISENDHGH